MLDADARRVRAPRRRAQGRRALGAQRPRRPAHAGDLRRLLVRAQEGARPHDPDPAAVHAEAARRDAAPAALRAPARPARGRHRAGRARRRAPRRPPSDGWSSATRATCSRRAGRSACSSRAPATGRSAWPINALLAEVGERAPAAVGAGPRGGDRHEGPAEGPAAGRQPQARREHVRVARRLPARGAREARRGDADSPRDQGGAQRGVVEELHAAAASADLIVLLVPALRGQPAGAGDPRARAVARARAPRRPADRGRPPSSPSASPGSPRSTTTRSRSRSAATSRKIRRVRVGWRPDHGRRRHDLSGQPLRKLAGHDALGHQGARPHCRGAGRRPAGARRGGAAHGQAADPRVRPTASWPTGAGARSSRSGAREVR